MSDKVTALIRDLLSQDEATRRYAAEDLAELRDSRAVAPLIPLLFDPTAAVREAAVDALKAIGGEETVRAVIPLLRTENAAARNAASEVLEWAGEPAVPHLVKLLDDDDKDVRKFAVDIMALIGSPDTEDAFVRALQDRDINVAAAAAEALGRIGSRACVKPLVHSLKASAWTRCSIAKSLGEIGGSDAVEALSQLTGDDDPMVVFTAVDALATARDAEAFEVLLPLLGHPNPVIVNRVLASMERIVSVLPASAWDAVCQRISIDDVVELTKNSSDTLRQRAVTLLGRLGSNDAVRPLIQLLISDADNVDEDFRRLVTTSLVRLAPSDIEPILDELANPNLSAAQRCELIDVLGQLGRPEAFDTVLALLQEGDVLCRRTAARMLARLDSQRAATSLCRALQDVDTETRRNAARALGPIGNTTDEVVDELSRLLDDTDPEVRRVVAESLIAIGSDRALTNLIATAHDRNATGHLVAIEVLAAAPALPFVDQILLASLKSPSSAVVAAAINGLVKRETTCFSDALFDCLRQESPKVRRAAVRLLTRHPTRECIDHLLVHFDEEQDPQTKYDCANALATVAPAEAVDRLITCLDGSPSPWVALGALESLGRIADARAESVVRRYRIHDDPEIADAASIALDHILDTTRCNTQTRLKTVPLES